MSARGLWFCNGGALAVYEKCSAALGAVVSCWSAVEGNLVVSTGCGSLERGP